MVKHQIHYASLEKESKNLWQIIYSSNNTQKCSKLFQWKMYLQCEYTLFGKSLFKREGYFFFCLIKLLFINVRCLMLMLTLMATSWRSRVVNNIVGSNQTYFWKRGSIRKGCVEIEDWGTSVYFVLGFQENYMLSL